MTRLEHCDALPRVAVVTCSPVLAIDVEQTLRLIGDLSSVKATYDIATLEDIGASNIRLAIVELRLRDAGWRSTLKWLAENRIRTIVISTGLEHLNAAGDGLDLFPNIIARFIKPFNVDELLPVVDAEFNGTPLKAAV